MVTQQFLRLLGSHISDITHILVVGQDYLKITYQEFDKHQVS
jgi:hypothetical protein